MSIPAIVNSNITIARSALDDKSFQQICDALTIPNPERNLAEREKIGGWWNIPKTIELYQIDGMRVVIPRGFLSSLTAILGTRGNYLDRRTITDIIDFGQEVDVRPYQIEAINEMLEQSQGIWQSPPGSGKTVAVLQLIRRCQQRAIVIVNNANIAEQWRDRSRQFLDYEPGLIGDNVWDERDFTVCIQQTLWSRREELQESGWFDRWGFVCLDEGHHLPATTFTDIMSRFSAFYRFGVSGTPYKQTELKDVVDVVIGPLIHETEKEYLVQKKYLIKPKVKVWETDFDRRYIPTHKHNSKRGNDLCSEYKYCNRDLTKKRHQNNYSDIISELIDDNYRNQLIVDNIVNDLISGRTILVLSKRIKHLEKLKSMIDFQMPSDTFLFTGKQSTQERMKIQERAEQGSCVLFSTIADEALDIPRASSIHLAWPTKNTDIIKQQIGRIERPHPLKEDAIINDYLDSVGPLRRQFEKRWHEVYVEEDLQVDVCS